MTTIGHPKLLIEAGEDKEIDDHNLKAQQNNIEKGSVVIPGGILGRSWCSPDCATAEAGDEEAEETGDSKNHLLRAHASRAEVLTFWIGGKEARKEEEDRCDAVE